MAKTIFRKHFSLFKHVLLAVVSAVSVCADNTGEVFTSLTASNAQINELANTICRDIFFFTNKTLEDCKETFKNPTGTTPSQLPALKVWCQSQDNVWFEAADTDRAQVVVLLPEPQDDNAIIQYSIVDRYSKYDQLSIPNPTKTYVLLSSLLTIDNRLTPWRREAVVEPCNNDNVVKRHYDLTVSFLEDSNGSLKNDLQAVISWNARGDFNECFEFINKCAGSQSTSYTKWPNMEPSITIHELCPNASCSIMMIDIYGVVQTKKYKTPVRVEKIDAAPIKPEPKDLKPEIPQHVMLQATDEGAGWTVRVRWAKPSRPPASYNVTLRADAVTTVVLSQNATEAVFSGVRGAGLYNVSVYATAGNYTAHTSRRAVFPDKWSRIGWAGGVVAWLAATLTAAGGVLCWQRLRSRIYVTYKPTGTLSAVEGGAGGAEAEWGGDAWEVAGARLTLLELRGRGAFGLVRRARLAPTDKEVAVKMLKEFPSAEEVRAFRLEMELMKSVGAHPHVVSLLGVVSGPRPLLVAEYCSQGDLLSFLRCSWDVMVSKRNAKYYNNNVDTSQYRNDLFNCKVQDEDSKLVVNKMYDLQGFCDMELTSLDLLSFCRQIAMGMEFLASNRLVHRDLAARNVLVTSDRTLKIADFGLSRDVYEENQYKQTGNCKMPVKWMAIESLTRRIYTSQSDVWSFGVVMWEVVTVGGAPYAGVAPARLKRLLRDGYRMPRPHNCSLQLYDLMLSCWLAAPRLRPSFAALHARLDELLAGASADHYLSLELDDDPPHHYYHNYFKIMLRGKLGWNRAENYERPLKAPQTNHYTSPPNTFKTPV